MPSVRENLELVALTPDEFSGFNSTSEKFSEWKGREVHLLRCSRLLLPLGIFSLVVLFFNGLAGAVRAKRNKET